MSNFQDFDQYARNDSGIPAGHSAIPATYSGNSAKSGRNHGGITGRFVPE